MDRAAPTTGSRCGARPRRGVASLGSIGARSLHGLWYCMPRRWQAFRADPLREREPSATSVPARSSRQRVILAKVPEAGEVGVHREQRTAAFDRRLVRQYDLRMSASGGRQITACSIAKTAAWEVTRVNVHFIGVPLVLPMPTWSSSRAPRSRCSSAEQLPHKVRRRADSQAPASGAGSLGGFSWRRMSAAMR
jgi:hypothetical protein